MQTQAPALASRLSRLIPGFNRETPPIVAAASEGALDKVSRLLSEGPDIDEQDFRGRTALHLAARRKHGQVAAMLLQSGASLSIKDSRGIEPLAARNVDEHTLHAIRQHYKRRSFGVAEKSTKGISDLTRTRLQELENAGFLKLSGFVSSDRLKTLRSDFDQFIANLDACRSRGEASMRTYDEEEHYWEDDAAYVSNNAFKYSPELESICCEDEIVELANLYMRDSVSITRGVAMRYLPHRERDNDMFGWHHDLEDKRFKLMILLTDLGIDDQVMSYVIGSHKIYHPHEMFFRNTCTLDYCASNLGDVEVRHTVGKAGDVFIFDSNGIHRGNRRPNAATRDVFFVEYDTDLSNIWGGDVSISPDSSKLVFAAFKTAEKKWNRAVTRKYPSWIENLPHVAQWR